MNFPEFYRFTPGCGTGVHILNKIPNSKSQITYNCQATMSKRLEFGASQFGACLQFGA